MADQFERTAVKLSQGPLGIIALFIVLIHGFASLVLGLAINIGENNRSVLVWFIVSFPVLVFFVFAWLVSRHHSKLYPPQAFREERLFLELAAFGRARLDNPEMQQQPRQAAAPPAALNTRASGSLFWLGHDLMWTADVLLRGAPSEHVLTGLAQARHHLGEVGLAKTPIEREILGLSELIRQHQELSLALRDEFAGLLGSIIDRIGIVTEGAQGDFRVPPHWKRVRA